MEPSFNLLSTATWVTIDLLLIGVIVALWRIVKGPSHADRIVALDLLSILIVALLAAFSIHADASAYLDVAISYALIAFLGTAALARFLERCAARSSSEIQGETEEK